MKSKQWTLCPRCRRNMYFVCGNPQCRCYEKIPKRCKPQVWKFYIGRFEVSHQAFNIAWQIVVKTFHTYFWFGMLAKVGLPLLELVACPYCGHAGTIDYWFEYWFERDMAVEARRTA